MRTGMKKSEDEVKRKYIYAHIQVIYRIESNPYEVRKNKTAHTTFVIIVIDSLY